MPFIYDTLPSAPHHLSSPHSPGSSKMPFKIFRRKSNVSTHSNNSNNAAADRTSAMLEFLSSSQHRTHGTSAPAVKVPQATRRPANPPTITNPFADHRSNNNNRSSSPPPSYTASPPAYAPPATTAASASDSPYAFLTTFDTVFLIDDSGSMAGRNWREVSAALKTITPICVAHDRDGIDIHFLNTPHSPAYLNITSTDRVQQIFDTVRPGGGTPTARSLNAILKPYLANLETLGKGHIEDAPDSANAKPLNIIVLTDGAYADDVESVIISAAKKLERLDAPAWQVGIQFFQVGEDEEAKIALEELDDELVGRGGCARDIVDTVPWRGQGLSGEGILKVVLGAVNRRLDRRGV